jgi:hypothetical protein
MGQRAIGDEFFRSIILKLHRVGARGSGGVNHFVRQCDIAIMVDAGFGNQKAWRASADPSTAYKDLTHRGCHSGTGL